MSASDCPSVGSDGRILRSFIVNCDVCINELEMLLGVVDLGLGSSRRRLFNAGRGCMSEGTVD